MKIILAVDGSKFTKKALAFIATHENLAGPEDELVVLHVQPPVPPGVKSMLGAGAVATYHREEAEKVLAPIRKFLARKPVKSRLSWKVGTISDQILAVVKSEKAQMIVMGTHGHGMVGRALMGSVAQRVVAQSDVPVLLVK